MNTFGAAGIRFGFDERTGLLDGFSVEDEGSEIAPLHRAPWVGTDETMPPDAEPLLATLGGDFFCAPFAAQEGDSPFHGWPPNSSWRVAFEGPNRVRAVLERLVHGATLIKDLSTSDGHPFIYQRHIFVGGEGRVPVANHANVHVKNGALIATSGKSHWETPNEPQESDPARGRSALKYPAKSEDPTTFPTATGAADLTRFPWKSHNEDFVVGVEAEDGLGWTAVTRPVEGDLYLSLRDPKTLPMTMLWQSDGGRDYAPWSGRHFGCLGVEEGAADHMLSHTAEAGLVGPGAITLDPEGMREIRHVVGAISWPSGERVADVREDGDALVVTGEGRAMRRVPYRAGFTTGGVR